jgi:hypothetical protein
MAAEEPELSVRHEQLALRAIRASFDDLNLTFFKGRLKRPVFALSDTTKRLGQFDADERTLELSRALLSEHSWGVLVEVLKHEMAHQYVHEVLGEHDESAHGPAFRKVCEERGFDARAQGVPTAINDAAHSALLSKIAHLLSLAQSQNEHEAQAAMNAAQRLMLKHNLTEVRSEQRANYCFRHLGVPTGRVSEGERILANILLDYFFVDTIWIPVWRAKEGKRGSVLEVCGTPANVELAHYVHSFLWHTADRLWRERFDRTHREQRGQAKRDRRVFLAGVMSGFRDKLAKEQRVQKEEGLVWVGDPALRGYLKQRHPRMRYSHYSSSERSSAHAEGRAAGQRIVLHRGVSSGASGQVRLLKR